MKNIMLYKLLLSLFSFVVAFGISGCKGEFEAEAPAVPPSVAASPNDKVLIYDAGPGTGAFDPMIECLATIGVISAAGFTVDNTRIAPFISTSAMAIKDQLPFQERGKPIFDQIGSNQLKSDWNSLWGSPLDISFVAAGYSSGSWWSGSNADGTTAAATCSNWTDNSSIFGNTGSLDNNATPTWLFASSSLTCSTPYTRLCIAW